MLQLVLGRSGFGKTEFVFDNIKKLTENGEKNILLITPEQFSFVAERRLLCDLGESGISNVENSSFSRLSSEVSKKYGGDILPILSAGSKAVLMKKAIEMVQDQLELFTKNLSSVSFISSVVSVYDEMKSCRVSVDDISAAAKSTDKEILSRKLNDIALIIGAYDSLIDGKFYDGANELTRLYEKLLNTDYFKDRTVFIDGFNGFVAQEYKIIEVILKQAKAVYITFCTDSDINNSKFDTFTYVNSNIRILKSVSKKANVPYMNPIILTESHRFLNPELAVVEKNAFSNIKEQYNGACVNISVYCAREISDECDDVAKNISRLLRDGYRANEIAVIVRDLDKYQKELQFAFSKYNIPYFNDERQNISSQPIVMFVNFLLRCAMYSYRSDDIFSLLKTGLTELSSDSINRLENYAFMWNINGKRWKVPFEASTKGYVENISDSDRKQIDALNKSREYIIEKTEKFIKNSSGRNCKSICKAIYYTLMDFKCDKSLKALAIDLDNNGMSSAAKELGRVWDLLMNILNELATVSTDESVTYKEFYDLFSLMISNEDLGSLPSGLDNVQIGAADRLRCNNPRAVFVLGANEGEFPQNISSSGLLTESDRVSLIDNDFKLYSYGATFLAQEKYFAYMAISAAREKLFVSYCGDGEKSSIITGIESSVLSVKEKCFTDNYDLSSLESNDNAFEILASKYNEQSEFTASLKSYFNTLPQFQKKVQAVDALTSDEQMQIKNKSTAVDLFKKDMYLSASKIEEYFKCSFKYFCKFGLNAKPRAKAEMDAMQTGTVIHYVLEQIIKKCGSDGLTALSNDEISILVNEYLTDFLQNKMGNSDDFTMRFKYQFMRLSKMLTSVVLRLKEEFSQSDFEAKAFELKIGDGSDNEPVKSKTIRLSDGGTVKIKGSIDRVDTFTQNGKQYVRVVDYKSGNKTFSLNDIMYGINLQMFVYLFTLCESDNELSGIGSGVLYMHSARDIINIDNAFDTATLESKENSSFKMKGIVLNDEENEIAEHMEKDLMGKFLPVKYTKKSGLTGSIVTLEEIGMISRKVDALVKEMGDSLHDGKIMQHPINGKNYDKTCEFCDYIDICRNRCDVTPNEMTERTDREVLDLLRGEEQNA